MSEECKHEHKKYFCECCIDTIVNEKLNSLKEKIDVKLSTQIKDYEYSDPETFRHSIIAVKVARNSINCIFEEMMK